MRLSSAGLSLAFALSLGIAAAPEARAQSDADRATARSLGQEGQQAFENKDYATAEDRFRRADKMVHAPTLVLGLARALAAEGKYVEAQESYNRIIREGVPAGAPEVFKRALDDAKKEVDAVAPKVGAVTITVKATGGTDIPDPQVVLDEHPINSASLGVRRAIDPGPHVLRATADGYKPGELKFSITEGGSADEPLTLEKDLSAPPVAASPAPTAAPVASTSTVDLTTQPSKARKIAPWVAFGVGGAGPARRRDHRPPRHRQALDARRTSARPTAIRRRPRAISTATTRWASSRTWASSWQASAAPSGRHPPAHPAQGGGDARP